MSTLQGRLRLFSLRAWPYLLLLGTLWVVRYWHSAEFGLYEDDLTHLPRAAAMSWEEVARFAVDPERIISLYGQGHPLFYTFIYTFTNLGWRLGGLSGLYLIGYMIEAANACLFSSLLGRLHSPGLGLISGLAYVLYAADTTQAFLTHSLGLHPSLTFLLLAGHLFLSGRRWLCYPLAGLSLLTYETVFLVFLGLPLLAWAQGKSSARTIALHGLILGLMLMGFVGWRLQVGDDRVGGLTLGQAFSVPLLHMAQGPIVSLGTYLYRPIQAVQAMNLEIAVVSLLYLSVFVGLGVWLRRASAPWDTDTLRRAWGASGERLPLARRVRRAWEALPGEAQVLLRLAAAGLVMLVLAYPLTFTVRAYAISGRDTRVHAAGVVGAAIVIGPLLLLWLRTIRRGRLLHAALGVWIGLLAGFGLVVQRDYALAWRLQLQFWSELLPIIQDAENGTAILVEPGGLQDTLQIGANTWNLPRVLDQLYLLPSEWTVPPRVFRLVPGWEHRIVSDAGLFQLNGATVTAPASVMDRYPSVNVILIETAGGRLTRRTGSLHIPGGDFPLKPQGEPLLAALPRGPLYSLMILDSQTKLEGLHR